MSYNWAYPYINKSFIKHIFEIGSRDCIDANDLATYFNCNVTAFECNPDGIIECKKNINTDRVTLIESAVSNVDGIVKFYPFDVTKYNNIGASSLFEIDFITNRATTDPDYGKRDIQSEIDVRSVRLDTFLQTNTSPDLICMDVQESELLVLEGLGERLKDVKYIITEASLTPTYKGGCDFFKLDSYLKSQGFQFIRTIEGTKFPTKTSSFSSLDILYERSGLSTFDVVIPAGPNDISMINANVSMVKKNVIGYRHIYIVTPIKDIHIDGAIVIQDYFSLDDIAKYHEKSDRNGWYLQQLLKLYAWKYIPDLLETYLVIDSDTFFVKPTTFMNGEKTLYAYGTEYHTPYFIHMKKLHPLLQRTMPYSGICHHMMFQTTYVKDLMELIEDYHGNTSEFWQIFLTQVDSTQIPYSGASEYELYFHYMFQFHPEIVSIRNLKWENSPSYVDSTYDFISWHWYSRDSNYRTFLTFLSECEANK